MTSWGSLGAPGGVPGAWAGSPVPQDPGRFWLVWSVCPIEAFPAQPYGVGARAGVLGYGALDALVSRAQPFPTHE